MANKVAGIDVHKKVLMVVVIDAYAPDSKPERRRFTTMPSEFCRLSIWLKEHGVEEAMMESTAQYWRPVWLELEPHLRLHLAQAFSNRAPRGRKHDFKDAERLVSGESGLAVRLQLRRAQLDPVAATDGSTAGNVPGAVCLSSSCRPRG